MRTVYLAVLLGTLLLVSCATREKYGTILDAWKGHNIDNLVDSWGYPDQEFKAPNGNHVYVYNKSSSYTSPLETTSRINNHGNIVSTTTGGDTQHYRCQTFFEINEQGVIIDWKVKGNSCVAF